MGCLALRSSSSMATASQLMLREPTGSCWQSGAPVRQASGKITSTRRTHWAISSRLRTSPRMIWNFSSPQQSSSDRWP